MSKKLLRSAYKIKNKIHDARRYLEEKLLLQKYGLNNKKEYNISVALAQKYRSFFRRTPKTSVFYGLVVEKLTRLGVLSSKTEVNINEIKAEAFLNRRLQTLVAKKFNLPIKLARQKIVQKKIKVNGLTKTHCSFLIRIENEDKITVDERSKRKNKV